MRASTSHVGVVLSNSFLQTLSRSTTNMGTYYFYVNETKREWFCIDPTGQYIKQSFIGYNFGSRAFGFLILANEPDYTGIPEHRMIGSWIGDRVYITGDDYDDDLQDIMTKYTDVGPEIIDMMSVVAPYDFYSCGGFKWLYYFGLDSDRLTEAVRRRLLKFYRGQNNYQPSEEYAKIVEAMRPKPPPGSNAG